MSGWRILDVDDDAIAIAPDVANARHPAPTVVGTVLGARKLGVHRCSIDEAELNQASTGRQSPQIA